MFAQEIFLPFSFKIVGFIACIQLIFHLENASELVTTSVFVFERKNSDDRLRESQVKEGTVDVKLNFRNELLNRKFQIIQGCFLV